MKLSLHLLALAVAVATPLSAQIAARQGSEDPKQFASPMILDIPLRGIVGLGFDQGLTFKDTQGYYCEDVTITRLLLVKKHGAGHGSGRVRAEITRAVFVRPSYDRFVTLNFGLVVGDAAVASAETDRFEVGEKKTRSFNATVDLTPEQFAKLAATDAKPLLRVTVSVASDR
jgi:hypothetical protein